MVLLESRLRAGAEAATSGGQGAERRLPAAGEETRSVPPHPRSCGFVELRVPAGSSSSVFWRVRRASRSGRSVKLHGMQLPPGGALHRRHHRP
uniref:Uncharacterized protein n=1 Tax=Oryza sativa subsp. japonica TaxID=39947 RepID=Q6Z4Z9_ORYSJ|nr:hypothetical protein [Oryza sativa Japonica Group]